jgi:hypothetical protein
MLHLFNGYYDITCECKHNKYEIVGVFLMDAIIMRIKRH